MEEKENIIIKEIKANNILYPSYLICASYEDKNQCTGEQTSGSESFLFFRDNSDFKLKSSIIELKIHFNEKEFDIVKSAGFTTTSLIEYTKENSLNFAVDESMKNYNDFLWEFNNNLFPNSNYISIINTQLIEKDFFKRLGIRDEKIKGKLKDIYDKSKSDELKEYIKPIINFPPLYKISDL